MKKRILSLAIVLTLMAAVMPAMPVSAAANISVGQYLEMGTYYGEPILWRCVAIDENGPLMLSDKIICLKPFDAETSANSATGSHSRASGRSSWGSNYWADSNMRSWLNSSASAGNVNWLCGNPPSEDYVWNGYNDYANEAGFLKNFASGELGAIKEVRQKSLVAWPESDNGVYTTGTEQHDWNSNIADVVQNYDTAYAEYVTDKMFLMDVKQVNAVYNNRSILGDDYYIGKLTAQAVANSEYELDSSNAGKNWYYWLRSPSARYNYSVRHVSSDGNVGHRDAYDGYCGVRPAFYLNLSSSRFTSGSGTLSAPYRVYGTGGGSNPINTPKPVPTEQLREWDYSPNTYSHDLALMCAKLSAAMYPKYCYGDWDMFYEKDNEYDFKKKFFNEYGIRNGDKNEGNLGLGEDNIHYVISRSKKNANYNGQSRPLVFVVCKGTTGKEWYGNMDITGTQYNSAQKNHKSFQAAATGLEGKIGEYIKKNNLTNALVVVTGHSRGAAVANLTAYDLTMGKVSGVDKNGVYGYTFACPSTTQTPNTSLKNIYNFCFADDFVPAFPLDDWGYGKHGETHIASADYLKSQNSTFRNNVDTILDWSNGRKSHFAYARTKALFTYVPSKWRTISDYYNGHPQMLLYREPLTLYNFTRQYLARYMESGAMNSTKALGMAGMLSSLGSRIYQPVTTYLINGGVEGFMNDNHQMYTYYEALKTGAFDQKEYLPTGWDRFDISLFSDSPTEYNTEQVNALKVFLETNNNAELLGWDIDDPSTWETVTWNSNGNIETISLYYTGLSGELNLTGLSDLKQLICPGNQITKLTLDGCNGLQILDCSNNLLEKLDLNLPALLSLECEYNYLNTEDMTAFDTLAENIELANYKNQNIKPEAVYSESDVAILKTILTNSDIWDLNASPSEWYGVTWEKQNGVYRCVRVDLRDTGLISGINVSGLDALEAFLISGNEIGSLAISQCPSLTYLSCAECKLTELEINDTDLNFVNCENNYLDTTTTEAVAEKVNAEGTSFASNQLTDLTLTPTAEYAGKIQATAQYSDSMFRLNITPLSEMNSEDFEVIQAEYDNEGHLSAIYNVICEEQDDGSYKCVAGIEGNCRVFVWNSVNGMKPVFEPLNINTDIIEPVG